jgi:hypothetical protein
MAQEFDKTSQTTVIEREGPADALVDSTLPGVGVDVDLSEIRLLGRCLTEDSASSVVEHLERSLAGQSPTITTANQYDQDMVLAFLSTEGKQVVGTYFSPEQARNLGELMTKWESNVLPNLDPEMRDLWNEDELA